MIRKSHIRESNDNRKWVNTELPKEDWEKLRKFIKQQGYKCEPSSAYNLVHVEMYLNPEEIKKVNDVIDQIDAGTFESVERTNRKRGIKESANGSTVVLKDVNTDVIPVVDFGCYGGILSDALEDVFVWDCVNIEAFDPNDEYYDEVVELINNKYDGTQDFYDQVLRYAPSTIQDAFNEYEILATVISGSCKWDRPSYYNYRDDSIEFDMSIDTGWVESKFMELKDNSKFKKFINREFSSRDGFISFMPNDTESYRELLDPNNNEYWKLVSAIIQYIVSEDMKIREDITMDLYESIVENPDFVSMNSFM